MSFIVRRSPARLKKYVRGPGWDGVDMSLVVDKAYAFVHLSVAAQPQARVYLTGYSRGGAGVIGVAKRLAEDGVNVSGMVLFDPVDRSLAINSTEISRNVKHVVYARRDSLTVSRGTFGNCGTIWHAPTRCSMRSFWGTHGGVGGVPARMPADKKGTDLIYEGVRDWQLTKVSYAADARCAREVWAWVNPHLDKLGFLGQPSLQTNA